MLLNHKIKCELKTNMLFRTTNFSEIQQKSKETKLPPQIPLSDLEHVNLPESNSTAATELNLNSKHKIKQNNIKHKYTSANMLDILNTMHSNDKITLPKA